MNTRRFAFARLRKDVLTAVAFAVPVGVAVAPRVAWAEEGASASAPAPAPASASASTSASAPASAPTVELNADDARATIERRAATSSPGGAPLFETGLFTVGHWEHQCVAPCAVRLDPKYTYRVAGDGLVPTDGFALPRQGDRVRVDARMGSSTGRGAGVLTTAAGAGLMALGGLALVASPILASEDVGSEGFRTGVVVGGVSALSVGVLAVGAGLYMWLANGSTAHTQIASR